MKSCSLGNADSGSSYRSRHRTADGGYYTVPEGRIYGNDGVWFAEGARKIGLQGRTVKAEKK